MIVKSHSIERHFFILVRTDDFYAGTMIVPSQATTQDAEAYGKDSSYDRTLLKRGNKNASVVFIESRVGTQCLRGTGFCIKNSTSDEGTLNVPFKKMSLGGM